MDGEARSLGIEGARLVPLAPHADPRGSLTELYRRQWIPGSREVVQANFSVSEAGVLRGLHFHRNQDDYWCVLGGTAFVGLFDLRRGSPTEGRKAEARIVAELERSGLFIPRGVAHGFYAETPVQLLYLVDRYFDPEDELGLAWDDPEVGIDWPGRDPILSDRDRANPSLTDVLKDPPPYEGS